MTLAADGYYVKVHQVIMAVASPYIKELINAVPCPHPVIFLNKTSYKTLNYLLEYIYSGEVLVAIDQLNELIEVAKELHIKGLDNMDIQTMETETKVVSEEDGNSDDKMCFFEVISSNDNEDLQDTSQICIEKISPQTEEKESEPEHDDSSIISTSVLDEDMEINHQDLLARNEVMNPRVIKNIRNTNVMQYTVSNQGSLQMILNRFVYYLKHTNRDKSRQWRCVDYASKIKCPAVVFTHHDMVLQRISSHTHPFHDKKILKKARSNAIFSAIQEAEIEGETRKQNIQSDE